MPINPIQIRALDYPANPNLGPAVDLSGAIASLGENIVKGQDRREVGRLLAGAIDPATGGIDLNKAATILAASGRDPMEYLQGALRQQTLTESMRHNKAIEETSRIQAEAAREAAKYRPWHFDPGGGFRPPSFYLPPDQPGGTPRSAPVTPPATGPASTPAPQTALPGPSFAEANPEEAPPYRVAGPMMPPPSPAAAEPPVQLAQAAPPAQQPPQPPPQPAARPPTMAAKPLTPEQNAWIEQNVPAVARNTLRGLLDYSRDPYKLELPKDQAFQMYDWARALNKDWSPENYGEIKKGEQEGKTSELERQKKLGSEAATLQADQFKDAKAAAELQPLLDDVLRSWEALTNFRRFGTIATGTGALTANPLVRVPQQLFGASEENLRNAYEGTLNKLRAQITAKMNQGQGAVSNYERALYAAIFPDVMTGFPKNELARLRQMQEANRQTIELGRETELGKQLPGVLREQPGIKREPPPGGMTFDKQSLDQYRTSAGYAAAIRRAQEKLQQGVPPADVRAVLQQIDPSGSLAKAAGL